MGLFDKLKPKKEIDIWSEAFRTTPSIYEKPDGELFGAVALTEGTITVLPKNPQADYKADGKTIEEWGLFLVSTSRDDIIGNTDYYAAIEKLAQYSLDANEKEILVRGLSLAELINLND